MTRHQDVTTELHNHIEGQNLMKTTKERHMKNDRTTATALKIAERWLIASAWKYTPKDIGSVAAEILEALETPKTS